jgi:putative transposase
MAMIESPELQGDLTMKKKRYKAEQIVRILQEAEQADSSIGDLCRRYEISEATFYRWRKVYGNMKVPEVRRLRELEQENSRLKRIVAERDLEIDVMKEVLGKKY